MRDVRNVSNQKFYELANGEEKDQTFNLLSPEMRRKLQVQSKSQKKQLRKIKKKEIGWNNYVQPISKYNASVHNSMRVQFNKI